LVATAGPIVQTIFARRFTSIAANIVQSYLLFFFWITDG
jgi:hypothetical protein